MRPVRKLLDRGPSTLLAEREISPGAAARRALRRTRGDQGTTLTEVLIGSTLLIVVLTLVALTMSVVGNVNTTVTSQYQEYDQTIPALAPLQTLLRAEVEPGPPNASTDAPQPGFVQYVTPQHVAVPLNYALQFYANIGTAYGNTTSDGGSAGPAMIVAVELDQNGNPVTSTTTCWASSPCSFQVRRYLPTVNSGASTCPVVSATSGSCSYSSTYTLITNVLGVVNSPAAVTGNPGSQVPIFSYSFFDPSWPANSNTPGTSILISNSQAQNNLITGLNTTYGYPTGTQSLTACGGTSTNYPTAAIACPLDAIQSVGVELTVAKPGAGTNGTVDNQSVIYRYPPTGSGSDVVYPYQWPTAAAG